MRTGTPELGQRFVELPSDSLADPARPGLRAHASAAGADGDLDRRRSSVACVTGQGRGSARAAVARLRRLGKLGGDGATRWVTRGDAAQLGLTRYSTATRQATGHSGTGVSSPRRGRARPATNCRSPAANTPRQPLPFASCDRRILVLHHPRACDEEDAKTGIND